MQSNMQRISHERHKDMGFNPFLFLMKYRSNCHISFQIPEGFFNLHQLRIEAPEFSRITAGQVRAQKIATFPPAHLTQLVFT